MAEIPEWRRRVLRRLDVTLTLFDLVLSAVFLSIGYLSGNPYFRGVGVGLLIAGVTGAVAVLYRKVSGSAS
jgi:VIT1/CCC1 family predicted Fe2+/Mn2+ transporter